MSIQSEIDRIKGNVAGAYAAVSGMGGAVPTAQNSENLAGAINSIPAGGGIPSGVVVIWSGAESSIPDGWALCDGQNGTPDLQDRFVLGAGTAHSVGETGGAEEVTLTVEQMPRHDHHVNLGNAAAYTSYISAQNSNVNALAQDFRTGSAGSSQPHPNMPPYYVLCYIIKL